MSKTTKLLLLLFTSILLLFTIYWFAPFSLFILHRSDHTVTLELFTKRQAVFSCIIRSPRDVPETTLPVVFDEKDVVVLSKKNFSDFISNNRYVMVAFYASRCYGSNKKLAPEYAAAATMLKGEASKAVLAKVDCTKDEELAMKYRIIGYPSLNFFVGGVYLDRYLDYKSRDDIVTWVKRKMIPRVYNEIRMEKPQHVLAAGSTIVLGFFDSIEGPDSEEFAAASKLETDVNFYRTTSATVAMMVHVSPNVKRPALVIENNVHNIFNWFDGPFTRLAIANFVSVNKPPLVITFNLRNKPLILNNPLKQLWLFAHANDSEILLTFQEAAKAFKGKLLFVYMELSCVKRHNYHESSGCEDIPYVLAYTGYAQTRKYMLDDKLTLSSIMSFGEEFLEDKVPISKMIPDWRSNTHSHATYEVSYST